MKGLIAILGSGESGKGAAILAKKVGYQVFVSDLKKIPKQTKSLFKKLSIDYEENHHSIDKITYKTLCSALHTYITLCSLSILCSALHT